jgi:hypothetical protein
MDPEHILSVADCETERTPAQLLAWVTEVNRRFARTREGKEYVRSRQGVAKKLVDSIYPFSLLMKHLFSERVDVVCKPNLGADTDETHDALYIDYRDRPLKVQKLEFAHSIYSYAQYVRRVYFPTEEPVFIYRKRRRPPKATHAEGELISNVAWLNKSLELIATAARRKRGQHHAPDTSLVIVFDDYAAFRTEDDLAALERFVTHEILPMELDFCRLFLLGWSGHTVLAYTLGGNFSQAQSV